MTSKLGTKSGVVSHYCNFQTGEDIRMPNRQTIQIDMDATGSDNLYSGRIGHRGDNGRLRLGIPEDTNKGDVALYLVDRGVDHPEVDPWAFPKSEGLLSYPANAPNGVDNRGNVSVVALADIYKIDTSEYDDTQDYDLGDNNRIYIGQDGVFTSDDTDAEIAIGFATVGTPASSADSDEDLTHTVYQVNVLSVEITQIDFDV